MKQRFFIRLNLILALVFLIIFAIILYSVNPFKAGIFFVIIFYVVLGALLLATLNLIGTYLKIPYWCRILIVIAIIFILLLQSFRF